jgi:hypothetical protein
MGRIRVTEVVWRGGTPSPPFLTSFHNGPRTHAFLLRSGHTVARTPEPMESSSDGSRSLLTVLCLTLLNKITKKKGKIEA